MMDSLLIWMSQTSLAVSVLIIAVLIIRKPIAQKFGAQAAYLLWLAPLLRLALPELTVLPPVEPAWSFEISASPTGSTVLGPVENGDAIALPSTEAFVLMSQTEGTSLEATHRDATGTWSLPSTSDMLGGLSPTLKLMILGLWAFGALCFVGSIIVSQRRFVRSILSSSRVAGPELLAEAHVVAHRRGLKSSFQLRVSDNEIGPLVIGIHNPIILVPHSFEERYLPVERQLALAHEYAHIARGDLVATMMALMARALMWPNPLLHYAFRSFRLDQEAACDASVLEHHASLPGARGSYAQAILKSVRRAGEVEPLPAASLSIAHPLKERLNLMKNKNTAKTSVARVIAAIAILGGLGATASYSHAEPSDKGAAAKAERSAGKQQKKSSRQITITVDKDETMTVDAADGKRASKVTFNDIDGDRELRVYDERGRLMLENIFGPDEEFTKTKVTVIDKDGESQVIDLAKEPRAPRPPRSVMEIEMAHPPEPPVTPGGYAISIGDDEMVHCLTEGDPGDVDVQVYSWASDDVGEDGDEASFVTHEVVCLDALDDNASPEQKAAALRRAIETMEREAERAQERRAEMISRLRAQLAEVEKDQ